MLIDATHTSVMLIHFYHRHLCLKGATASPSKSDEFASGDFVRVELDLEVFRMLQEVHGEWSNGMGQVYTAEH